MGSYYLLAVLALLFPLLAVADVGSSGGLVWKPVTNVRDPHVIEVAQFAVSQHNKEFAENLSFEKVIKGVEYEEPESGIVTFRLEITVKSDVKSFAVATSVTDNASTKHKKLGSFTKIGHDN